MLWNCRPAFKNCLMLWNYFQHSKTLRGSGTAPDILELTVALELPSNILQLYDTLGTTPNTVEPPDTLELLFTF